MSSLELLEELKNHTNDLPPIQNSSIYSLSTRQAVYLESEIRNLRVGLSIVCEKECPSGDWEPDRLKLWSGDRTKMHKSGEI